MTRDPLLRHDETPGFAAQAPRDPLLRMSDRQYRDLHPVYEPDDPLGWVPKLLIGAAAALFGAGCGLVVVFTGAWRRLLG